MNVQPVIGRELVAQSRQPGTYWLRVVGAGGVMIVFALGAAGPSGSGQQQGEYLFDSLNAAAYHLILLCVPLLTADSISREKREGTLGLLFLTPLRAGDIVLGKAISQALRGSTLLVALLPVLLLPVLLGGVGWIKALATAGIQAGAFLIALAAGLVVSSLAERPVRAAMGSVLFAFLAVTPLNFLLASVFGIELWPPLFLPVGWLPSVNAAVAVPGLALSLSMILASALAASAGGVWQAARQVALFWQEAEDSTDRLRAAVGMWIRIVGGVACVTQLALATTAWLSPARSSSRETMAWLNLLWLAPLPLLGAAVCVNRLAARAGDPLAGRHSGWWFFWLFAGLAAVCPLVLAATTPPAAIGRLIFMVLNAATLAGIGLTAGVLAFAWRRRWATALVWSLVFATALTAAVLTVVGAAAWARAEFILQDTDALADSPVSQALMSPVLGIAIVVTGQPAFLADANVFNGIPSSHEPLLARMLMQNAALLAAFAMTGALALPRLLSRRVQGAVRWHAADETRALRRDFCEPLVGRRWFARRQHQRLNTNPIGWLHARQWSARLTGWGWCLAAVITQVPVFLELRGLNRLLEQQAWLLVALQAGVAFAAAGSFQREKLSGVLELILVTPVSARQVVVGRWAALIRQFLPTLLLMALLLGLSVRLLWYRYVELSALAAVLMAASPLISLPLIGLYLSLRLRSVMAAWLATCGLGLAVSAVGFGASVGVLWVLAESRVRLLGALNPGSGWSGWQWAVLSVLTLPSLFAHVAVSRFAWVRLVRGLANRQLVLS